MPSFSTLWFWNAAAELDAAPVVDARLHAAQDVPASLRDRVLDLDDLRAERGEHPGRAGTGELAGEVADPQVRERAHRYRLPARRAGRALSGSTGRR